MSIDGSVSIGSLPGAKPAPAETNRSRRLTRAPNGKFPIGPVSTSHTSGSSSSVRVAVSIR